MDTDLDDDLKQQKLDDLISRFRAYKMASHVDPAVKTENNNNNRSFETMSEGLAELLGDDDFEEPAVKKSSEPEKVEPSEVKDEDVSKYIEQSIPEPSIKEFPAVKLTFKDTVSISQLKRIQETFAEHGSLCANSTDILTDRQLCVYFKEREDAWSCLKWVHNSDSDGQGLRDLGLGLILITADYLPVSKWLADYDDHFTIRIAFDGLKNYADNHIELFKTLSRFGDEPPQCILIDSELKFIHARYKKQYDAEIAISSIDRAFFFGSWCRATKAQPVRSELTNVVNLCDIPSQKVHRKDVSIKNSNGCPVPRTSWKNLLTHVSQAGPVESLYGDGQGVIVSFKDLGDANRCVQTLDKKKFLGKTLLMTKKFHIDQLK